MLDRSIRHSAAIAAHDAQVCTVQYPILHDCSTIELQRKRGNSISFYQEVAVAKERQFLRTEVTDKQRIDTPLSV